MCDFLRRVWSEACRERIHNPLEVNLEHIVHDLITSSFIITYGYRYSYLNISSLPIISLCIKNLHVLIFIDRFCRFAG